jgi:type I restriction enzyme S subunit
MTGIIGGISSASFSQLMIPLPPLAEQRRIVAKVDELMDLCDQLEQQQTDNLGGQQTLVQTLLDTLTQAADTAEFEQAWSLIADHFDTLFTTESSIDQLKQTLLQLAAMGKLVPQDSNDEPANLLLEKIADEKNRLAAEGMIKKQKPLPKITEDEKPFKLSNSWEWVRLGTALKKITDGTHHSPPNGDDGDYLYISAKNIKSEGILMSNVTYVTKDVHDEIYSRCDPEYGDVLYIKDGATTGIATINNLKEPFSMLSSVALLKATQGILNTYLLLSLKSPYFYNEIRSGMTGVAITRVTLTKLENAIISLPPLAEQHRIVAKVDELMSLCDALKARIAAAQTTQLQLADAIVEQAVA